MSGEPIRLHAVEKGTGFPLVLLHGNGESSGYFEKQIAFFSKEYHVIAPDTRGHGESPRGDAPFTLAQFEEDLFHFLEERKLKRIHLLGFSDGGNIALLFALAHPERVERLVLNGANLFPGGMKLPVLLPVLLGYGALTPAGLFSKRAAGERALLALMAREPHISPEALGALPMPTLVIAGERDMIRERHTRRIAAALPKGELAILPGDHFLAAKNSEAFNARVLAFLRGEPSPAQESAQGQQQGQQAEIQ